MVGTRSTISLEEDLGSAPGPEKLEVPEEKTIREVVNDSGGGRAGSGGSGRGSAGGRRSFGSLNVDVSDAEEGLVQLKGKGSVEKLESVWSNEKKAVSGGAEAESGGKGRGVGENGGSLDRIGEGPDGIETLEAGTDVNGEMEENGSCLDGIGGDPDGKTEEINEDMDDEGHEFLVGDFVWGKIKSHPWWPAQICDPSDASEYALKLKAKDRLLVAYFGDGTFAWCNSSQLKPFEENFGEMSRQSSSKAFVNAVQQAVDEVGRLVRLKMSCICVKEEFLGEVGRPLAVNAGIKEGVRVPEGRVGKLLDCVSEPAELLAELKRVAEVMSMSSELELNALKSWLSAFYCSKGGYRLPVFIEAQPVPGLEDDWREVDVPSKGHLKTGFLLPEKQDKLINLAETKEGATSEKAGASSGQNKRKGGENHSESNLTSESGKRRAKLSKTPTSSQMKKLASVENGASETKKGVLTRSRKKDERIAIDGNGGETKEEAGDSPASRDEELRSGVDKREEKEQVLVPSLHKSKTGKRSLDIEVESLKVSNDNLVGSPKILSPFTETLQKKDSTELIGNEITGGSSSKKPSEDEKSIDPMKANVSTHKVLSGLRSAAVNPSSRVEKKSFKIVGDFVAIFRDSIYHNGSNYELYKKKQPHKKRKKLESEPGSMGKDRNQITEKQTESGKKRTKKSSETKSDKSTPGQATETSGSEPGKRKSKNASGTPDLKKRRKKTDETASPASLFVTFGPGSSLPTKSDLIKIYGKFGELDETETEMFYTNFCARVSFVKFADAQEAFNHSQNDSPFGAANVTFRLHNLAAASKVRELSEISNSAPAKKSRGKTRTQALASQPPTAVGEASQVDLIKQKLERMTSMLGDSNGQVSDVTKSKLESEIKELLGTVSTMV
ncbi:PWWP domain-containing protein 3-like [Pyrus x bretschneideri]|uniref:PWWP domain-containing protein 3-like n=1 Tax=Pyrus x bretschneideri TaxID=225117 RepID=UPI00202FE657|nr:PWWP domain-containing protein 3-like [Pyrus x bretschneideri]